jgi:hypothetical protein
MMVVALALAVALSGAPKGPQKTQLKIDVNPDTAVVYVDGRKKGTGKKPVTLNITPGRHAIKVVNKGDEHTESVSVKKGEVKTWQWAFEDDRRDVRAPSGDSSDEGEAATGGAGDEGGDEEAPEGPPSEP